MRCTKAIILSILILLLCLVPNIGYAQWQFSGEATVQTNSTLVINSFDFDSTFSNKDCLDKKTLTIVNNLKDSFNDKNSSLYLALKYLRYGWYIGNMDDNCYIRNYLNKALSSYDSEFMIFKNSDGTYYLYITYKNLDHYHYGASVKPVYRITYKKVNGTWYPIKAEKGQCAVTTYDLFGGEHQKALAMTTFN